MKTFILSMILKSAKSFTYFLTLILLSYGNMEAQTIIFSESIGSPSGTTSISSYASGTVPATFQNTGVYTYSNGSATTPADIRITSPSSTYSGASGLGNVFFSSVSGSYGFSIENISAAIYKNLKLQFGYHKSSASLHANLSVEFWDGATWVVIANNASDLFNESASASAIWYLSKSLTLPAGAEINGLKIRFVKSGSTAIRIDDIKLSGCKNIILPSATNTALTRQCNVGSEIYYGDGTNNYASIDTSSITSALTSDLLSITLLGSQSVNKSSVGINQEHASILYPFAHNFQGNYTGTVNIKLAISLSDTVLIRNKIKDSFMSLKALNSSTLADTMKAIQWFKSSVAYDNTWRSQISGNIFPSTMAKTSYSYGVFSNGVNYVAISGLPTLNNTGFGAGYAYGPPPSSGGVSLPVTWAGIDVKVTESGNQLTWKTASEKNSNFFNVEYSYDATNFINNEVKIAAAGNSSDLRTYYATHSDYSPYVYYRIKQVDLDGRVDYSVTKLAKRTTQSTFNVSVYPIPMNNDNVVNVKVSSIDKSKLTITLTDITGKVIRSKSLNPVSDRAEEIYDMSPLTNGVYFIEVQNGQGREIIKISK